jgi:hypothetical protein
MSCEKLINVHMKALSECVENAGMIAAYTSPMTTHTPSNLILVLCNLFVSHRFKAV